MPDELKCQRCGRNVLDLTDFLMFDGGHPALPDRWVYVCPCGPLAVVEGEWAKWYAPMGEGETA